MDREQIVRILNHHAKFINDGSGSSIMAVRQRHFPRVADDIAKLSPSPSTEVENGWVKAGKMVIDILVENHQAQIAGFYNDDKTDEEKKKRNAVIEEYSDLIGIFKAKFKNESK